LAARLVSGVLRLRGVTLGRQAYVSPRAVVRQGRRISVGAGTAIGRAVELNPQGGFIAIGDHCSLQNGVVIYGAGGVTIEGNCRIASGAMMVAFNHVFEDPHRPIRTQGISTLGIHVEDDVWVGARAIVLDGVRIGRGSVVSAGAVVTRSVPAMSVVAGVPARVIKSRV
jgi:acetyltransferase-like isoleucine patch superfamily enzyme